MFVRGERSSQGRHLPWASWRCQRPVQVGLMMNQD
jgi:hypothetical protein